MKKSFRKFIKKKIISLIFKQLFQNLMYHTQNLPKTKQRKDNSTIVIANTE